MKKSLLGTLFLALVLAYPVSTMAAVDIHINIPLPPLIAFPAPPAVVVIPETNVYVVPDVDVDVFFYAGWWWRPWEGRWYRSRHYDSGWVYYQSVPAFYKRVPPAWREDYREHRWQGHRWDYHPVPHDQVQRNWRGWEKNRYWEKQNHWGVQGLRPQARSRQPSANVRPQSSERPQSREMRPQQQAEPQHREGKEPSRARQGKPGKEEERHERR